jgi:hypothetical protein
MANPLRLTKGEAVAGKLISNDEVVVGTDLEVADDAYVTGAFGKGVAVTNIADGASMTFTAANLLSGIVTATPTQARNLQAPTAALIIDAVDAETETGLGFEFTVINLAGATHALTLDSKYWNNTCWLRNYRRGVKRNFRCSLGFNLSSCNLQKVIK